MAAIHDLVRQIADPKLRDRIEEEWDAATRKKKFGLVYERHLPELVPIYDAKPKRGDLVALRGGALSETWQVRHIKAANAFLVPSGTIDEQAQSREKTYKALSDLIVVKQFGEPIFPALTPVDVVQNGPTDAPWHALIEADNYHALQLLEYLYAGKVDCIYIDPPYNTGARDWKYNNDYVDGNDGWRHSKWLSFMEKRLRLAKSLLKPDTGVLICTIDEHEVHHLGNLLEDIFPECAVQMATIVINAKGVSQGRLARVEEYAMYVFMPDASLKAHHDDLLSVDRTNEKRFQTPRWEWLLRGGSNSRREDRHLLFYPVFVDPETKRILDVGEPLPLDQVPDQASLDDPSVAWPVRRDGSFGNWQVGPTSFKALIEKGFVRLGGYDKKRKTWTIQYLNRGTRSRIDNGEIIITGKNEITGSVNIEYSSLDARLRNIKTVWNRGIHDSGIYGSSILRGILGEGAAFTFPKSIYSTRDAIASVVRDNSEALVVDFFAGSGTTLNAVNLLNATDGGRRQCILVTNNEVAADEAQALAEQGHQPGDPEWESKGICKSVTWPRSKFTILGYRDDGTALPGDYITGRMVEREKSRRFRHLAFVTAEDFRIPGGLDEKAHAKSGKEIIARQKSLVALIDGLPQNSVTVGCRYIASEDYKTAVLFDPDAADDWLAELGEENQATDFFIVADTVKQFKEIRSRVEDLLGPQIIQDEEKRPMAEGFAANLAYFKLDFLDKNRVELGAALREVLPLLWLKAGAIGARPELPSGPLPDWFVQDGTNFAVLIHEARIKDFMKSLKGQKDLAYIFIVTDSEEAYRALSDELRSLLTTENQELKFVQLYRDYLANFVINTRNDNASMARGDEA